MVIDSRQKIFVMNIQLRECFARAKSFRLKKVKKSQFQKMPSALKSQTFKIGL